MGNRSLFPGVAVPLAFFCTLFFRHRKKSVSAPWDGQSLSAPESARQAPPGKEGLRLRAHQRAFRSPFLEAFGPRKLRNLSPWGDISTTRAAVGASCSLTGSCFRQSCHVMPLAGGFPLAPCTPSVRPLKITPMGRQVPLPRRSRRVRPRRKISPRLNVRTKKRKPHTPRRFRFPIYFRG